MCSSSLLDAAALCSRPGGFSFRGAGEDDDNDDDDWLIRPRCRLRQRRLACVFRRRIGECRVVFVDVELWRKKGFSPPLMVSEFVSHECALSFVIETLWFIQ